MTQTRYQVPVTATTDVEGNATFTFPDVPEALWAIGTVQIAGALVGAQFVATVSGQPWGTWYGPVPSPVIEVDPRTHVTIAATNLAPSTILGGPVTYTAWFIGYVDTVPILTYPQSGGAIPLSQAAPVIPPLHIAIPGGLGFEIDVPDIEPWMQALAFRWSDDGTSAGTAVLLTVIDTATITNLYSATVPHDLWFPFPIQGRPVTLEVQRVGGAAVSGTFVVVGLQGFVLEPRVVWDGEDGAAGIQVPVSATVNAGTTLLAIAAPLAGYAIRLKVFTWVAATAPAAGQHISVRGITSGSNYLNEGVPAAISTDVIACDIWVPAEGLNFVNTTNQALSVSLAYELWPEPFGPV